MFKCTNVEHKKFQSPEMYHKTNPPPQQVLEYALKQMLTIISVKGTIGEHACCNVIQAPILFNNLMFF